MRRNNSLKQFLLGAVLALGAAEPVLALTAMSDDSLSQVAGQDGLTVVLESPQLTAQSIEWTTDVGGFDPGGGNDPSFEASLQLDGVSARTVDSVGNLTPATPVTFTSTLDTGQIAGEPALAFHLDLNRTRLQVDNMRVSSQPAVVDRSFGKWALDAPLSLDIRNQGLFQMAPYDVGTGRTTGKAYVRGEVGRSHPVTGEVLETANLFYRQAWHAHSYMTMHDFHALWEMPEGTLGIDQDGIVWRTGWGGNWDALPASRTLNDSDLINLALDFEYLYKMPVHYNGGAGEDFIVTSNDRGLMHFGWLGSIKDAEVRWRPGGNWYGYDLDNKSGGLNLSASWDYVNHADAIALGGPIDREFRWQLGETSDVCPGGVCAPGDDKSRINFELRDWVFWGTRTSADNLNGTYDYGNGLHTKPAASHFPLIAFDVINGSGQGVGGVCWGYAYNQGGCPNGGSFINVQPGNIGPAYATAIQHNSATGGGTAGGLAIQVRDGQIQGYSRLIRLLERDASGMVTETDFDWGLIYSLANVDGSFYLYPGGHTGDTGNGSLDSGVIADITLMSQTFDENDPLYTGFNWEHGTHLLIADTNMDTGLGKGATRNAQGIGFLSTSFLLAANDTRIMVKNHWNANDYYEGGLDFTSPASRFNYKATFGGGVLPDDNGNYGNGPRIVQGALIDLNLEGAVNLRFSPARPDDTWNPAQYTGEYNDSRNFLGYSGALRLGSLPATMEGVGGEFGSGQYGTYLVMAEPGRPDVAWRFANVNGDIAFTNGMIDLRGTNEDNDGKPKMVIANNMLIGSAAAARVDDGFGGVNLNNLSGIDYAGTSGRELSANMMLGNNTLGTAVIPSAQVYSSITLTPQ